MFHCVLAEVLALLDTIPILSRNEGGVRCGARGRARERLGALRPASPLKPNPTPLPTLIDIGQLFPVAVVVAHPDRERIAERPLHLAAMHADRDGGMRLAVGELGHQRVDVFRSFPLRRAKGCERFEQILSFLLVQTDPSVIRHCGLPISF
jgi:hypothetical protein